jgi:hypothetical protein
MHNSVNTTQYIRCRELRNQHSEARTGIGGRKRLSLLLDSFSHLHYLHHRALQNACHKQ